VSRRRVGHRDVIEADLETLPLMGLFVVLIPMLLLSAVFLEISVITMQASASDAVETVEDAPTVAVRIDRDHLVITLDGARQAIIDRHAETSSEELADALTRVRTRHPQVDAVRIEAGAFTRYEVLVEVMDRAREAGLVHASLAGAE
jgi:biopolymer transport protein ExbD